MAIITSGAFPLDPAVDSGTTLATKLNELYVAYNSQNLNAVRPPYISKGGLWAKDNGANPATIYLYNGTTDIELGIAFADKVTSIPTGGISATNVQAALAELDNEKITASQVGQNAFPQNTRLAFAQASAPTGWTQDVSDNATNRMLRVVNTQGNAVGGVHSPILNNVVAAHTHGFTTGIQSANHTHAVNDAGHSHSGVITAIPNTGDNYLAAGRPFSPTSGTSGAASTGITIGSSSSNHTHSGGTDNGSSATNWQPRYIDMIICSKD